jgi:mono/diheme cytochrome c family protein
MMRPEPAAILQGAAASGLLRRVGPSSGGNGEFVSVANDRMAAQPREARQDRLATTRPLAGSRAIWEMAMRRMTLFATLALAFVPGFSSSAGAQSPVERGEKVYAAEKCSVCHSIGGQGNTRGPLDGVGSNLSAEEIRQWIVAAPDMTAKTKATRKPPMRSYPNLPKDDVEALVAYMLSLKK